MLPSLPWSPIACLGEHQVSKVCMLAESAIFAGLPWHLQDAFNSSRMAMAGPRAAAFSPARAASNATPQARAVGLLGAPGTPGTGGLSTTSFSPPEPLALLAIKPLGRVRRGAMGGRGRRPSETEEREFRRRAAALRIQISPYWKRRGAEE